MGGGGRVSTSGLQRCGRRDSFGTVNGDIVMLNVVTGNRFELAALTANVVRGIHPAWAGRTLLNAGHKTGRWLAIGPVHISTHVVDIAFS